MRDLAYRVVLSTFGFASPVLGRRGLFLCLHSIGDAGADFNGAMAVSTRFLSALVTDMRARDVPLLSITDALASMQGDPRRPFLTITFDDGYRGVFSHAFPVLLALEAPFAVFVTSSFVDGGHPMWWDALERLVSAVRMVRTPEGDWPTCSTYQKRIAFERLSKAFRDLPTALHAQALRTYAKLNPALDLEGAYRRCLSWDMLEHMLRSGLATVGAHTYSHPILADLRARDLEFELVESRRRIEDRLGRTVDYLAYPFGQPAEVGQAASRIARAAGYKAAFTTTATPVGLDALDRCFELPRVLLSRKAQSSAIVRAYMTTGPRTLNAVLRDA